MRLDGAVQLARRQLVGSIRELEKESEGARFNTLCIRAVASASTVLGQNDVAEHACRLLRAAPDGAFWAGMITNIELPKTVPERMRTVDPPEELEERHPPYREEEIVGRIRSYAMSEGHCALCLEGKGQEARLTARSAVQLQEVGATFAVLGDYDGALSVARDPFLERFRQRGVLLVLAIELFRRGRIETCETILAELESSGLGAWNRVHLALGFSGREPWNGYPYPDW
jgi:hypothetical protein